MEASVSDSSDLSSGIGLGARDRVMIICVGCDVALLVDW